MSTVGSFWLLIRRDLHIAWREGAAIGTALGFYVTVVVLVPLGIGPDLALLARIGPGILWIGLLLAAQVTLGQMFETDQEEGALEVLATGPLPLELVAAAKALAHWLTTGLPLAILAPLLGLLVNLDLAAYPVLIATTVLGTLSGARFAGQFSIAYSYSGIPTLPDDFTIDVDGRFEIHLG